METRGVKDTRGDSRETEKVIGMNSRARAIHRTTQS